MLGQSMLKGLNQLSHCVMSAGRFIVRSLTAKLYKTTNQPVDHDYAATSCCRCL